MNVLKKVMGNHQSKSHKIGPYSLHVVKQIAEGGFSYVYLVKDTHTSKHYALKRIMVRDNDELDEAKHEIDIMKKLNHKNIVRFIDYNHSKSTNEIFILMENCSGGHLVDLMMKRQQNRLSEQEILSIFSDICESVAHMHSVQPPIIHRDLKVENVLLDEETGLYKLCDFGSATQEIINLKSKTEMQRAEDDIARHTTPQYRPPEMIDLYRSVVINEKADIWALGCLLYKLLFYTTPFEEAGSLGILNGNYTIPPSSYSTDIINLIRYMLHPDVGQRPDIFYVTNTVMKMRGMSPIYPGRGSQYINPFTSDPYLSPPSQQQSLSTSREEAHKKSLHQQSKPLPPVPQQQQQQQQSPIDMSAFNDFELSGSQFNEEEISPHLRRRSPNNQQQQTFSSAANKRRANLNKNTPNVTPVQHMNGGKVDQINLDPTQPFESPPTNVTEDITNLIIILTNPNDSTIDQESITQLKAYTTYPKGIMHEIVKRPLREPVVCLKSLVIVHKLLMEGQPQFKMDAYENRDLFHNLHLGWLKQKEKFSFTSEYLSQYSLLIHKLVLFHQKHYFIEGSFAFDEIRWGSPDSLDSSHPISITTVASLLSVLEQVFHSQNSVSDLVMNNSVASIPLPLITQSVSLLNTQSYAIYCFINGCLNVLTRISAQDSCADVLPSLITRFHSSHQMLRENYHKLSSLPPFASEIFFPTLQKAPPIFNLNTASSTNQPSSLNSSGSHPLRSSGTHNHSNNPFDTGSNEPSFNPFDDNFVQQPVVSPRVSGNNIPPSFIPSSNNNSVNNSNNNSNAGTAPHSPVISRRNNNVPLVRGFPHSTSLDDARLYTLILTPSPSPPLSPSINNRMAFNQQLQHQQQQSHQHHPSAPSPSHAQQIFTQQQQQQQTQQQFEHLSLHNNSKPQHQQQQQQQGFMAPPPITLSNSVGMHQPLNYSTSGGNTPNVLNSSTNSTSSNPFDQQSPMYQHPSKSPIGGGGNLMPPPVGGSRAPVSLSSSTMGVASRPQDTRGHRRSQSSTTDEIRRRNMLQQQLEQNRDFVNYQRQQIRLNQINDLASSASSTSTSIPVSHNNNISGGGGISAPAKSTKVEKQSTFIDEEDDYEDFDEGVGSSLLK